MRLLPWFQYREQQTVTSAIFAQHLWPSLVTMEREASDVSSRNDYKRLAFNIVILYNDTHLGPL
jgi:hypothetical protein